MRLRTEGETYCQERAINTATTTWEEDCVRSILSSESYQYNHNMGCRPSKHATSKVRAADDSRCLCSPRKVRKNHKCSGGSSKPVSDGSKKQSLSSGHKPRTANGSAMDFPAFSTTTAVYRKSASKTSKITLRLSCDGSTLEIEQCDYDLEKTCGDLTPKPRPWHSAPNLTKLKDTKSRLFRENLLKHSTSAWSPSVSSTVSAGHGLTVHAPASSNAPETQSSNKSSVASHRSSNDSHTGSGSFNGRVGTGKTPLLKTTSKHGSDWVSVSYRNFAHCGSSVDGPIRVAHSFSRSEKDYEYGPQKIIGKGDNLTSSYNAPFCAKENTDRADRSQNDSDRANRLQRNSHRATDDSESSAEFEHISVNVITSYPLVPADSTYRLANSNHSSCQFHSCAPSCLPSVRPDTAFLPPQLHQHSNIGDRMNRSRRWETADRYELGDLHSGDDVSFYTPTDCSSVNLTESNSILTFVALGCPVLNDITNYPYSSDDDNSRSLFTPQPDIIDPYDSLDDDVISFGASNFTRDITSSDGLLYRRDGPGEWWGRRSRDSEKLKAGWAINSLNNVRSVSHRLTTNNEFENKGTCAQNKEPKREWIDGELRLVKDDVGDIDPCSSWSSDCWSNVKFPVMKTHVSASSLLCDQTENQSCDQGIQNHRSSPCINNNNMAESDPGNIFTHDSTQNMILYSEPLESFEKNNSAGPMNPKDNVPKYTETTSRVLTEVKSVSVESINVELKNVNSSDLKSVNVESISESSCDITSRANDEICLQQTTRSSEIGTDFLVQSGQGIRNNQLQNQENDNEKCALARSELYFENSNGNHFDLTQSRSVMDCCSGPEINDVAITDNLESHGADYLMELLADDLNKKIVNENEAIHFGRIELRTENDSVDMASSIESYSDLVRFNCLGNTLLHSSGINKSLHTAHVPDAETRLSFVKFNILKQNLSKIDPLNDIGRFNNERDFSESSKCVMCTLSDCFYAKVSPRNTLFDNSDHFESMNCTESMSETADRRLNVDKKCWTEPSWSTTLNGTHWDVIHSFENCKYLRLARGGQASEVNDYLTIATTTTSEATQLTGHKQTRGVKFGHQGWKNSNVSTRLCPLATSPTRIQSDFKEGVGSIRTQSGGRRPPSRYFERHLNHGCIDPPEITSLNLEGTCPPPTQPLTSFLQRSVPQCSLIPPDPSNRYANIFSLRQNGLRGDESVGFNGDHDICTADMDTGTGGVTGVDEYRENHCYGNLIKLSASNIRPQHSSRSSDAVSKDVINELMNANVDVRGPGDTSNKTRCIKYQTLYGDNFNGSHLDCADVRTEYDYNKMLDSNSTDLYIQPVNQVPLDSLPSMHETVIESMSRGKEYKQLISDDVPCFTKNHFILPIFKDFPTNHGIFKDIPTNHGIFKDIPTNHGIFYNHIENEHPQYNKKCPKPRCKQEMKKDSCFYISGFPSENQTAEDFDVHSLTRITPNHYEPVRNKLNFCLNPPSSSYKSPDLLPSDKSHFVEFESDRRQYTQTDIILDDYRHITDKKDTQPVPRNNVLSLVKYFEKVPFVGNNAK